MRADSQWHERRRVHDRAHLDDPPRTGRGLRPGHPLELPDADGDLEVGAANAAGNTVVLKPSDTTPVTTLLMAEIMAEFLPPGVFNVVCGDPSTGASLVSNRIPAMASITGSVRAGMEVARAAAGDLKRVHLELGGKAPVIVFDDSDIASTAEAVAMAGYFNAGQDCTAATRVLAAASIHDELVSAVGA